MELGTFYNHIFKTVFAIYFLHGSINRLNWSQNCFYSDFFIFIQL
jgi:hypothetical protein